MPEATPRAYNQEELDRLLTEMHALIPDVARQAGHRLGYHPDEKEREGHEQDLYVTLKDDDYYVLRQFRGDSEPRTWLFKIAVRQILKRLMEEKRKVNIDDLPPESLTTDAS